MKIKLYQMPGGRMMFCCWETWKKTNHLPLYLAEFKQTFRGEVKCKTLEDVYSLFNLNYPDGYKGRSLSVSDIVEVEEDTEYVKKGFYFCDSFGFRELKEENGGLM